MHFKKEAVNIHEYFPTLTYSENEKGEPIISGELILSDEQGVFIDSFFIRIEPSEGFPFKFPFVFETGGRLPNNIDWHIFPDGHCCIKSMPEESIICKNGISLIMFIKEQVIPYFFNQKYREINGYYLRERSHGYEGNIEFFKECFKTNNLNIIARGLYLIKSKTVPNRVEKCFCGSGIKYRKCHRETFRLLNSLSDEELEMYISIISRLQQHSFNNH